MGQLYLRSLGFLIRIESERRKDLDYILENRAMFGSIVAELDMGRGGGTPNLSIAIKPIRGALKMRFRR